MHAVVQSPSVLSAAWPRKAAATPGENAAQAAGTATGNTTPLEPEA